MRSEPRGTASLFPALHAASLMGLTEPPGAPQFCMMCSLLPAALHLFSSLGPLPFSRPGYLTLTGPPEPGVAPWSLPATLHPAPVHVLDALAALQMLPNTLDCNC